MRALLTPSRPGTPLPAPREECRIHRSLTAAATLAGPPRRLLQSEAPRRSGARAPCPTRRPHFLSRLSRLERLAPPETELALSLYRDVPLLRAILAEARLPDGTGRIAIAMADGGEGPFLVVERDGAFVTCLAQGMRTELPVLSLARLEGIATRMQALRERIEVSRRLTGKDRPSLTFVAEALADGPALSRERFLAVEAWVPVLGRDFARVAVTAAQEALHASTRLQRAERLGPKHTPDLRLADTGFWESAHAFLLSREQWRRFVDETENASKIGWYVAHVLAAAGSYGVWFRALRVLAALGPGVVPILKHQWQQSVAPGSSLAAGAGLVALALSHGRLSAEVRKVLERDPASVREGRARKEFVTLLEFTQPRLLAALEAGPEDAGEVVATGHEVLRGWGVPAPADDTLARAAAVNCDAPIDFATALERLPDIGAVVRTEPAALYLPESVIRIAGLSRGSAEQAAKRRKFYAFVMAVPPPEEEAPAVERPARNGPCPCGSGKKHKRCCGEAAA